MITFGPVPSRRLGRSLGINNIPPKSCPYSCIYCQVGPTPDREIRRRPFYGPEKIRRAVEERIEAALGAGESIDYLTFVPDGEPTLDEDLGRTVELLRPFNIRIGIISNGSLIWRREVRESLNLFDWVSLKVDSVDEDVWRRINRPSADLELESILAGMLEFAGGYKGILASETLLVEGVNTDDGVVSGVAEFLGRLKPHAAYLSMPIRPPAESGVHAPDEEQVNRAYQIFSRSVDRVEYLTGYEGNAFAAGGDPVEDLLSITSVHPMREEAVREFLARTGSGWDIVQGAIDAGDLKECEYEGRKFYSRSFPHGIVQRD